MGFESRDFDHDQNLKIFLCLNVFISWTIAIAIQFALLLALFLNNSDYSPSALCVNPIANWKSILYIPPCTACGFARDRSHAPAGLGPTFGQISGMRSSRFSPNRTDFFPVSVKFSLCVNAGKKSRDFDRDRNLEIFLCLSVCEPPYRISYRIRC